MKLGGTEILPEGQYRCQPCRRIESQPIGPRGPRGNNEQSKGQKIWFNRCLKCNKYFCVSYKKGNRKNVYCSKKCSKYFYSVKMLQSDPNWIRSRNSYQLRASVVPGLSENKRRKLLRKWQSQSRSCYYCDKPATTVDHVVPLARGGTNFEGNLVPACRSCNGSKHALFLIMWRMKKNNLLVVG